MMERMLPHVDIIDLALTPTVSLSATGDGDVVDASGLPSCPVRSCSDALSAANQSAIVDWLGLGSRLVQDHVCDRSSARNQTCRAPPPHLLVAITPYS
jgi:hypothetical protein